MQCTPLPDLHIFLIQLGRLFLLVLFQLFDISINTLYQIVEIHIRTKTSSTWDVDAALWTLSHAYAKTFFYAIVAESV